MYINKQVAKNIQKTCCLESEQSSGKDSTDLRDRNIRANCRSVNIPGDVFKIKADSVWRSVSFAELRKVHIVRKVVPF